jgi:dihydroxyacid dehydratase/phosphogluconate dehydratase
MRELSIPAAMLVGMGLSSSVAMVSDGRYSGATRGLASVMSAQKPIPVVQSHWFKMAI